MADVHPATSSTTVVYPDSDGQPMADNTEQFEFISMVQGNLDAAREDFVAGDHLWYPVQGDPKTRVAPDVYVAVGRPKGHRGSYKQWEEGGVPLTVVFEWWSPNSNFAEQVRKLQFYERYGVQEFYTWDQVRQHFAAFVREAGSLVPQDTADGFVSPVLGIRMVAEPHRLRLFHEDGQEFRTWAEIIDERNAAKRELDAAQAERDAVQTERDAAKRELDAAQAERDAVQAERDAVQAERDAAEARASALQAERDAADARAEALHAELAALRSKLDG